MNKPVRYLFALCSDCQGVVGVIMVYAFMANGDMLSIAFCTECQRMSFPLLRSEDRKDAIRLSSEAGLTDMDMMKNGLQHALSVMMEREADGETQGEKDDPEADFPGFYL